VVVELKVAKDLNPSDEAQLINELKSMRQEVGLLINFGRTGVKFIRVANLENYGNQE
ncbi:MAG: GxxExxY protein, partial [Lentisphaerae bacterium]|nr:GxxExxY protein [Lentisphaerota bacterium]